METEAIIHSKYHLLSPTMNERSRRLWAGAEARALGRGGIAAVQRATGMVFNTIHRGMKELDYPELLAPDRVRGPGGGRKKATQLHPELGWALDQLVEPGGSGVAVALDVQEHAPAGDGVAGAGICCQSHPGRLSVG